MSVSLNYTDLCLRMQLLVIKKLCLRYCRFISKYIYITLGLYFQVPSAARLSVYLMSNTFCQHLAAAHYATNWIRTRFSANPLQHRHLSGLSQSTESHYEKDC